MSASFSGLRYAFRATALRIVFAHDNSSRDDGGLHSRIFRRLEVSLAGVALTGPWIVIWLTYDSVMRPQRPVGDRIVGAICVYLMIGFGWSSVYQTLDGVMPGSLSFPAGTAWATSSPLRYRYFSFVTLATLGYGDVTPVTALTGTLASMEAIAGQLYVAITVARLVALSIVDRADPGRRPKSDA